MTAVRSAALAGLVCGAAAVVWASGGILLLERTAGFDARILARGLEGLWLIQAIAIGLLAPWLALRWGWRRALLAELVFVITLLPLLALCWLAGAAGLAALGIGSAALLVEALLIVAVAGVVTRVLAAPFPAAIATATLQILSASAAFAVMRPWLELVGL